jgi:hypothetical protein
VLNKNWKDFYNNVKDMCWPACPTVDDIDTLPKFVIEELETHNQDWKFVNDEDLKVHFTRSTNESDLELTVNCIRQVEEQKSGCDVVHSVIPGFCVDEYRREFFKQLPATTKFVPEFEKLDLARDGYHYDVKTATQFVNNITELL